jgi:hypothetical protein
MQPRSALVPRPLHDAIERVISGTSASQLASLWTAGGTRADPWLVIKYIPTKYCRDFLPYIAGTNGGGPRLRISDSPGFTWGTGNYVVPLAYPISTAIYGRAGIVAVLDPGRTARWRIFDARVPANQDLYIQWTLAQPAFRWLAITCHANLANQFLRNAFREAFRIDCVLFYPDQRNAHYTGASDDWMCVSDWNPRNRLARGDSAVLQTPRLAILVSEEFATIGSDVRRRSLIGPLGSLPTNAALATAIRRQYNVGGVMELTA